MQAEAFVEQPVEIIDGALGFCTRTIDLAKGLQIPQHAHKDDHATLVSYGLVRAFIDGKHVGDFGSGQLIGVKAGVGHLFLALTDARLTCIFFDKGA
jgi:quercetin dioxygenase-like cupin family protein